MSGAGYTLRVIARMESDFSEKFGIPRQAGLVEALESLVVFEPEFRNTDALRGIDGFSHLWLIWQFSEAVRADWSPTVRPPRLGGNERVGVFASRSPFRPNALGLSCVRLLGVEQDRARGPVLRVAGADLMNGTPIYDIKPYLPYADSKKDATGGFAPDGGRLLRVEIPPALALRFPPEKLPSLRAVLARDPRPAYQNDPSRCYGMNFAGFSVRFFVREGTLTVTELSPSSTTP